MTYATLVATFAGGCGSTSSATAPTPTPPPDPGNISGTVSTLYNKTVDGPIQFLDKNEVEIAKGTIQGGNYTIQNIKATDLAKISDHGRVRIGGGLAGTASFIVTELNVGKTFATGNNSTDYKVGDRGPGVLEILEESIRVPIAFGLWGNKRPEGEYTFWADSNSDMSYRGTPVNIERRLSVTQEAVKYVCANLARQDFRQGITFQASKNVPEVGNNNMIIKYNTPYAPSHTNWKFEKGYTFRGAQVELLSFDEGIAGSGGNFTDWVELEDGFFFHAETYSFKPSISNDNVLFRNLQEVDFKVRDLVYFESLGTQKKSLDVLVESWELPV